MSPDASGSQRVLAMRFAAEPRELKDVRDNVLSRVRACGASEEVARDVMTAVDEACQNVIRHAYGGRAAGEIVLEIEHAGDEIRVDLVDFAPPTDPARVRPRDLEDVRPGGLGTHLMRELMDSVAFVEPPPGCGNRLRMVKRIR